MCSTPQKQPAATVHFCVLAGKVCPLVSEVIRIPVEKGRARREKKEGMVAMRIAMREAMKAGAKKFRLKVVVVFERF